MECYLCGRELTEKERRGYYDISRIKCNVCKNEETIDELEFQISELKEQLTNHNHIKG